MPEAVGGREQVLPNDGPTRVVRIDSTVHRPARPFTATVHAYLTQLRSRGFTDAPEPLGLDSEGREVLSYVEGDVPIEPLPSWAVDSEALRALAVLIRRLHEASVGWVPGADATWGSLPGVPPVGLLPLFDKPELVSHQDYCPGNVVFRGGLPAALIDFDLAQPTTRVADVVNALRWWVPLQDPQDRSSALAEVDVAERIRFFVDAYGMTAEQRGQVVSTAIRRAHNAILTMRAAAEVDPVFRRWWAEGAREGLPRAEAWLMREAPRLSAALR